MQIGDPFDFRPGAPDETIAVAAPTLGSAPDPVATPDAHDPVDWRRRVPGVATSLVVHAILVVLFLLVWRSMIPTVVSGPEAISVEVVHSIPGETPPAPKAEPAPRVEPALTPEKKPDPPPAPPPPPPAPPAAAPTPEPPAPEPPPQTPSAEEALKAALREPPPEPKAAAAQSEINQTGTASTNPDKHTDSSAGIPDAPPPKTEAPVTPPATPDVLTTGQGSFAVPAPAPKTDTPKPQSLGDPTQPARKATEQLAAALATDTMPMPLSFRAALSAHGTSDDADYRGSVFGALSRAQQAVNDTAQARHLKGQAVIAIVLSATGAIASATIVQSSGHADSDAFALDMVRRAAPYPPPPPGASHTFTPAIAFGDE